MPLYFRKVSMFFFINIAIVWYEFDLMQPAAFWHLLWKITNILIIHSLVAKTLSLMVENSMGNGFLWCEEFDGLFFIRAFLIERECKYPAFWLLLIDWSLKKCFLFDLQQIDPISSLLVQVGKIMAFILQMTGPYKTYFWSKISNINC